MGFFRPWLVAFLLLALALAMVAEASKVDNFSLVGDTVADIIGDENEMLMDSEANHRTLLGRQRFISYGALRANQVPCGYRGRSYYNCHRRTRANPYNRGCNAITHCARKLD